MKSLATADENAPENLFQFKLNERLKDISSNIHESLNKKIQTMGVNIAVTRRKDELDIENKLKEINEDYINIEEDEIADDYGSSSEIFENNVEMK